METTLKAGPKRIVRKGANVTMVVASSNKVHINGDVDGDQCDAPPFGQTKGTHVQR